MAVNTGVNEMLIDEVFGLFTAAEQIMLQKLAKRVKRGATTPGWTEEKLNDVTALRVELEGALSKIRSTAMQGVTKAVIKNHIAGLNSVNDDLRIPRTPLGDMNIPLHVQRLILDANGIIKGASLQISRSSQDIYRSIINDSTSMMLTGVETRLQASQRALNVFAQKGITGFVDRAGRNWEMASYVEMAVRTVSQRSALQGHIDRSSELGHDLMIVSHFGKTCPICAPWEGKPLSISGNTPGYPSLTQARAAGLFHPNCKHTLLAYFPGITEVPRGLGNDDQAYQNTQRQRYNERQIRKWKRVEAVAMTPPAAQAARAKIIAWQKIQRELIERTGLKRKYYREGIKNRTGNPAQAAFGKHALEFDDDQKIITGIQNAVNNPVKALANPKPKPVNIPKPIEPVVIPVAPAIPSPTAIIPKAIPKYDPDNYELLDSNDQDKLIKYAENVWRNELSKNDIDATKAYIRTGNSFSMNQMLYSDRYAKAKTDRSYYDNLRTSEKDYIDQIDNFSDVIKKHTIPMDMRVVRNTNEGFIESIMKDLQFTGKDIDTIIRGLNNGDYGKIANKLKARLAGIQYENKSFISTSFDPTENVFQSQPIQIEFTVDKGTKGLVTKNYDESEIVFDKGTKVEIVDVHVWKHRGDEKLKIIARILE